MREILDFLKQLEVNNNREWFEIHKDYYKKMQQKFEAITEELIVGIGKFDPSIIGVPAKICTYRIYRDTRFSPNKLPYKTYMGAHICPGGKSSGYAGYYFHLENARTLLAVGLHCPMPNVVKSVRDEIEDNSAEFLQSLSTAKDFTLDMSSQLKRVPKGFPQESHMVEYLKLKEFDLVKPLTIDDNTVQRTLAEFKTTKDFALLLNRAVKYAYENN